MKCPLCGGTLVIEFIGTYGDIYKLGKNLQETKTRIKHRKYEHSGDTMIYCFDCGTGFEREELKGDSDDER